MFLSIPATSCESERSFRNSGLVLSAQRCSMGLERFQNETRVRSFLCATTEQATTHEIRLAKTIKVNQLLELFHSK